MRTQDMRNVYLQTYKNNRRSEICISLEIILNVFLTVSFIPLNFLLWQKR